MFLGRQYFQNAITEFQKSYPKINIELRLEDQLVDIIAKGFDVGFRTGEQKSSSLISTKIARKRLLIMVHKINEIEVPAESAAPGNMVAIVTAQMVGIYIQDKKLIPI